MKKKLLPFILGCAMVTAMPLVAHAEVSHHVGEDIVGGTSAAQGDKATTAYNTYKGTADGHNEFTEHNTNSTTNTVAKVFGSGAGSIGNTKLGATGNDGIQGLYPQVTTNEQKDANYGEPDSLANSLNPSNTGFREDSNTNDTEGTTDLETAISEFDMTIPASTVLPIGATAWKIGQVEMAGRYFINPDKIGLILTKQNFHHSDFTDGTAESAQTSKVITFDVQDAKTGGNSMVTALNGSGEIPDTGATILTFDQDGTKSNTFPYEYTYTSERNQPYTDGEIAEINEAKDLWVLSSDWSSKTAGKYTGKLTFTAYIINGNLVESSDPNTAPRPRTVTGSTWWPDVT